VRHVPSSTLANANKWGFIVVTLLMTFVLF
jgi:hypothetical protein